MKFFWIGLLLLASFAAGLNGCKKEPPPPAEKQLEGKYYVHKFKTVWDIEFGATTYDEGFAYLNVNEWNDTTVSIEAYTLDLNKATSTEDYKVFNFWEPHNEASAYFFIPSDSIRFYKGGGGLGGGTYWNYYGKKEE